MLLLKPSKMVTTMKSLIDKCLAQTENVEWFHLAGA